jgi:hypothetical protein
MFNEGMAFKVGEYACLGVFSVCEMWATNKGEPWLGVAGLLMLTAAGILHEARQ